jgi:hypothetical protein
MDATMTTSYRYANKPFPFNCPIISVYMIEIHFVDPTPRCVIAQGRWLSRLPSLLYIAQWMASQQSHGIVEQAYPPLNQRPVDVFVAPYP